MTQVNIQKTAQNAIMTVCQCQTTQLAIGITAAMPAVRNGAKFAKTTKVAFDKT